MKGFYESYIELSQEKGNNIGLYTERERIDEESQFLNSLPIETPLIGMIFMTGEGIEAEVNDISFTDM